MSKRSASNFQSEIDDLKERRVQLLQDPETKHRDVQQIEAEIARVRAEQFDDYPEMREPVDTVEERRGWYEQAEQDLRAAGRESDVEQLHRQRDEELGRLKASKARQNGR